jgi:RecA-family ATPase
MYTETVTNEDFQQEKNKSKPKWQDTAFSLHDLEHEQFAPVEYLIPNVIPATGVTLLCAKPKSGKSWLVFDGCICSSVGGRILGLKPKQGDVLYLALEDSKRRLKQRAEKLCPSYIGGWSSRLTMTTDWRRLHEGGIGDIREWHANTVAKGGNPVLVVIDVLAKVRQPVGRQQLYEADYGALVELNKCANELGIAIIVVHHTRKMAGEDLMETVSGSYGLSGAVDTILVMAPSKTGGVVLNVRGRDVESTELAIEFDRETCKWQLLGEAAKVHISQEQQKIMKVLDEVKYAISFKEIAASIDVKPDHRLEALLSRMAIDGKIARVKKGHYATTNLTTV